MKPNKRFLFLFTALSFIACNKENAPDCFQKGGEQRTVVRDIEQFPATVVCNDMIDLHLFQSDVPFLEVSGPKNLLPELMTNWSNASLEISNENTCNIVRSYSPRLSVRLGVNADFKNLDVNGQGEVSSQDTLFLEALEIVASESSGDVKLVLNCDDLKCINHAGVSNFTLSGIGRKAEFFHQGFGVMNAEKFEAAEVYSNNNSIGKLKVFSKDYLFAHIGSKGNLYYRGNPLEVDASVIGSGTLIALD